MKGPDTSPMRHGTLSSEEAGRLAAALGQLGSAGEADAAPGGHPQRIAGMPILRRLGAGGMGEVFEAEQVLPRRRVAIKLLRPDLPLAAGKALEHEIEILGRLEHPGIARIYTAGVACVDGVDRPWFAMELIDGAAITEHVRRAGLPLQHRLELMRSVCEAVQHAHDLGVVHLDLKPSNILVDGRGIPRILDFGIGRLLDSRAVGLRGGTPRFAAPEQLAGQQTDERADVHALGAVLSAVAGRAAGAPGAQLQLVIGKATAAAPGDRYASPRHLATDLARLLSHRPVRAQGAPAAVRARLLLRRRRGVLAAGAAAALAAAAGGSLWLGEARRASEADRALSTSEAQRAAAEAHAQREAANAEEKRRLAESQAALARFSASLLDAAGAFGQLSAGGPTVTPSGEGDRVAIELREGTPFDAGALAEIVRLQSAILADPGNAALHEELRRRTMSMMAVGTPAPEPPAGAGSFRIERSGAWTETTRIEPEKQPQ